MRFAPRIFGTSKINAVYDLGQTSLKASGPRSGAWNGNTNDIHTLQRIPDEYKDGDSREHIIGITKTVAVVVWSTPFREGEESIHPPKFHAR